MPIPARFHIPSIDQQRVLELTELCHTIEEACISGEDVTGLIAMWNRRANREYRLVEFTTYSGAVSTEEFVIGALLPAPKFVSDLTYEELKAVWHSVATAEIDDAATLDYYLQWLEVNLPQSNVGALLYWPNEWFEDESAFRDEGGHFKPESELSDDQNLRYAMLKSGRMLADAPTDVTLPFAMPKH